MSLVYVFMAQGFEEMELVITIDILRRAGIDAKAVSITDSTSPIIGSRGIPITPDLKISEMDFSKCDLVALPGGIEGTKRLAESDQVLEAVKKFYSAGKYVAAICAGPTVLVKAGILKGKRATSHPSAQEYMQGCLFQTHRVVVEDRIITSRAAGTTFEFAFKLVEILSGKEKIREVNKGVLAILPEALPELMN
ncbi:MAG: DJ-1/PfpI family protein [Candidatus Riflebacteria bacterium]|nr:DJ-1/PfpI family protein [Candidatus Riflebacteria bacterium]